MTTSGLDLGPTRATYVRLSKRGTEVRLEAAAFVPLGDAADEAERAIVLADGLARAGGPRGEVALGLPGRDAILRYLHFPVVPPWRLRLLMEHEVADVAEKAGEPLSSDFRTLEIPEDVATQEGAAVLVGLAKEGALLERLKALEAAGLRAGSVLPTSLALVDAYVGLGHVEEGRTAILVDASPDGAEVAILRDGRLVFARGLPAGRDAPALAAAVASSVQFCRSTQKLRALPVDCVRVSGALARSAEHLQALRSALKVEVETFDPLERIDISGLPDAAREAIEKRGPELALAVGLALARAHPRCVALDLTPRPILARREFLTRTLFLYAAGAALAAALAIGGTTAAIARSNARARHADLVKIQVGLEARRDAVNARAEENRRAFQIVNALARETQAGGAALRLAGRLREATPARVTIAEVSLEPAAAAGKGGGAGAAAGAGAGGGADLVLFRLKGEVDNAAGDAIALLGRFEAALRDDPGIASAKVTGTPVAQPGAQLDFVMAVAVRAQARGPEE